MTTPGSRARAGDKPHRAHRLDATDLQLLSLLVENGRMSNAALAQAASIAESTCHSRLQALRESGVIQGVHADVDPAVFGRPLQALVSIRIHPEARDGMQAAIARLAALPEVLDVFFLAGNVDLVLRVAVSDATHLRHLVLTSLNQDKAVAGTETSIVMDHVRARGRRVTPSS